MSKILKVLSYKNYQKKLEKTHNYEYLLNIVQNLWLNAKTRNETLQLISLGTKLISSEPRLGIAFFDGIAWVDTFLEEEAEKYMLD